MELMKASQQWSTRPADQRFWTVEELLAATQAHKRAAVEADIDLQTVRVEAHNDAVRMVGETGNTAELTHFAFGQLAARAGAPAGYLRELPATLAVQNINYGLKHRIEDNGPAVMLLHQNGGFYARAIT